MNNKKRSFVSIGIPSLFLIFSVLCLVILSLLTLQTSRSDLALSRLSLEQTTAYYEACGTATDLYQQAEETASEAYGMAHGREDYYSALEAFANRTPEFTWDINTEELCLELPFSESQALYAVLKASYPRTDNGPCLDIAAWYTIPAGTWEADTRQPVFQGGSPKD
ncbi:hypothetical protein NXH76_14435 [Blautia schinkii]|nr:hypothetical protein [Blautia schinkii]